MMRGFYGGQDSAAAAGLAFDALGIGSAVGGIAQAAGSVAAAGIQAGAIKDAAQKQAESAKYAQDLLQGRYDTTRNDLQPYRDVGADTVSVMRGSLPEYGTTTNQYQDILSKSIPQTPNAMTQAELESTPGYQFTLGQGLKATQNSAAARGLGVSGAALKGAATYATGLSDQTYATRFNQAQQLFGNQQTQFGDTQNLFNNQESLKSNAWNRLAGLANVGLSGSAMTASLGASAAKEGATIAQSAGAAQGAAGIAQGNALAGGLNGVGNAFSQYQAQQALQAQNGSGIYGSNTGAYAGQGFNSAGYAPAAADSQFGRYGSLDSGV